MYKRQELAGVAVDMVEALQNGTEPEINDTETYDNGEKVVPSYLLKPVLVDSSNWEEIVVESGYHDASEF